MKTPIKPIDRLIVALDVNTADKAVALAEKLKSDVKFFKIGLELFTSSGNAIVKRVQEMDCNVFLDLKFHDIPNTVAKAASVVTALSPFMFNIHASGGSEMMRRAVDAVKETSQEKDIDRPKILAVTILTSLDEDAIKEVGFNTDPRSAVLKLATLAKKSGCDGVVASPAETKYIRKELGEDFLIVTPGVRPVWAATGDQKRIATPSAAIKDGADYIVVGRPVTEAKDPVGAAKEILKEMEI